MERVGCLLRAMKMSGSQGFSLKQVQGSLATADDIGCASHHGVARLILASLVKQN